MAGSLIGKLKQHFKVIFLYFIKEKICFAIGKINIYTWKKGQGTPDFRSVFFQWELKFRNAMDETSR